MSRLALVAERERSAPSSRYELLLKIASGATATVYVARRTDLERIVAVKRAHPHLLDDPAARRTLLDEARLASRIRHANVTSVHDVEETEDDLLLVMDYVEGASLAELLEAAGEAETRLAPAVAVRIALDVAHGLAAVHELVGDDGRPLGMVHRDVSPQNVLVGLDGTSRVADFGLARLAPGRDVSRTTGAVQGKLAYVAPEVLTGSRCTAKSELFALGVVVWEALAARRLFRGENEGDTLRRVLEAEVPRLSAAAPHVGPSLDAPLARALAREPSLRHPSVRAFAAELEEAARRGGLIGTSSAVGAAVEDLVGPKLARRRAVLHTTLAVANEVGNGALDVEETASLGETPAPAYTALLFARSSSTPHAEPTPHAAPVPFAERSPAPRPSAPELTEAMPLAPPRSAERAVEQAVKQAVTAPIELATATAMEAASARRSRAWPLATGPTIGLAAATLGLAFGVGIGVSLAGNDGSEDALLPLAPMPPIGFVVVPAPTAVNLDALPDVEPTEARDEPAAIDLDALPDHTPPARPRGGSPAPKAPADSPAAGTPPPNPYKNRRP